MKKQHNIKKQHSIIFAFKYFPNIFFIFIFTINNWNNLFLYIFLLISF